MKIIFLIFTMMIVQSKNLKAQVYVSDKLEHVFDRDPIQNSETDCNIESKYLVCSEMLEKGFVVSVPKIYSNYNVYHYIYNIEDFKQLTVVNKDAEFLGFSYANDEMLFAKFQNDSAMSIEGFNVKLKTTRKIGELKIDDGDHRSRRNFILSPNKAFLAYHQSFSKSAQLMDLKTGFVVLSTDKTTTVSDAIFSADSKLFGIVNYDWSTEITGIFKYKYPVYSTGTGKKLYEFEFQKDRSIPIFPSIQNEYTINTNFFNFNLDEVSYFSYGNSVENLIVTTIKSNGEVTSKAVTDKTPRLDYNYCRKIDGTCYLSSPNGHFVASLLNYNTFGLFEKYSDKILFEGYNSGGGPNSSIAFSIDGKYFANVAKGGLISYFDLTTKKTLKSTSQIKLNGYYPLEINFWSDSNFLHVRQSGICEVFEVSTGQMLFSNNNPGSTSCGKLYKTETGTFLISLNLQKTRVYKFKDLINQNK